MAEFQKTYDDFSDKINGILDRVAFDKAPESIYEPFHYIISGKGKRIRPVLTMIACGAAGGEPDYALEAACAVEILHNFTLVHDDIMDNSPMRRGKQTIHEKWNEPLAILSGDLMAAFGYRMLENYKNSPKYHEILSAFTTAFIEVCEGQALDMDYEHRSSVSLASYIGMIDRKTARLLAGAAKIGGYCALAEEAHIEALNSFAGNLGLAFQIQDDLLDLIADESQLGKRIGNDIIEGKKTYLIIRAVEKANSKADRMLLAEFFDNGGLPESRIPDVKEMLSRLGVLEQAQNDTREYFDKALEFLGALPLNYYTDMLKWLLEKLNKRNY